ncbi:hypothetical protein B5P43_22375 [Bacillus sp. SRB_336]|nr:hypothetical protein B5P43_22375 [Bacillus sp. SRB_336]
MELVRREMRRVRLQGMNVMLLPFTHICTAQLALARADALAAPRHRRWPEGGTCGHRREHRPGNNHAYRVIGSQNGETLGGYTVVVVGHVGE